ncbi:hypothetical protein T06_7532 [Trichinella sp. T6]|nr:hypothetical protein T06_11143 [Trichinella sp. T6]KRX79705.1 hypothetical protein T06_7532 [Trichinella sp. T6]
MPVIIEVYSISNLHYRKYNRERRNIQLFFQRNVAIGFLRTIEKKLFIRDLESRKKS